VVSPYLLSCKIRLLLIHVLKDDGTHAKYERPPPQSAADIAAEQAPAPTGGKSQLDDALRWARNRTGWAPKFEDKKDGQKADEGGTLLDHPTFLEGKLGDKFFGGKCMRQSFCELASLLTKSKRLVPQCRYYSLRLFGIVAGG
jgi:hypothetical protein